MAPKGMKGDLSDFEFATLMSEVKGIQLISPKGCRRAPLNADELEQQKTILCAYQPGTGN